MAYCEHCGVELAPSERRCPLCDTPVLDPNRQEEPAVESSFPELVDLTDKRINTRFLTLLIGLLLLAPLTAVVLIDLLTTHDLTWSRYVMGAELCLLAFFVFPSNVKLRRPYLYIAVDVAVAALYVLMIHAATGAAGWYLAFALPLILALGGTALLGTMICRRRAINKLGKCGWLIILLALLAVAFDLILSRFLFGRASVNWSGYVAVPLLVVGLLLWGVSRSRTVCDWIRRNLFI